MIKLCKTLLLTLATTLTLYAQPAVHEQVLASSGGDDVAISHEFAIVGDKDSHKVNFYKTNFNTFDLDANGSYQDSYFNGNLGASVAIDGNIALSGSPTFTENRIFRFRGGNNANFYEYLISTDTWIERARIPDTFPNNGDIGDGGALVWTGGNFIYALAGGGTNNFYAYRISTDEWFQVPNKPTTDVKAGGAMVNNGQGYLYVLHGGNRKTVSRYNLNSQQWEAVHETPDDIGWGGSLVVARGNVYALRGAGGIFGAATKNFYRYNNNNSWTTMPNTPKDIDHGGSLAYDGTGKIYALRGNAGLLSDEKKFYEFDLDDSSDDPLGTWVERRETPEGVGQGGALVFDGTFMYAQQGDPSWFSSGNTNFWRYDTIRNEWDTMKFPTGNASGGGALTVVKDPPGKGIVYVFEHNTTSGNWERKLRIALTSPEVGDYFGTSVGLKNNGDGTAELVMGAPGKNGKGIAATYHYDNTALAVSGNVALEDGVNSTFLNSGSSNIYAKAFGTELSVKDDRLAISDPDETNPFNTFTGSVHTYKFDGSLWNAYPSIGSQRIKPEDVDGTGRSVAIEGDITLVSDDDKNAWWETDGSASWTFKASEASTNGSLSIDQRIILSTNAPTADIMHFWPIRDDNVTLVPNGNTFYTLQNSSGDVNASTNSDLHKDQAIVNDPGFDQAIVMDVPCGLRPTELIENVWAMVSVPCGDGLATPSDIFGDELGNTPADYGDSGHWVMYEQDGSNYNGTSASMVLVNASAPMELGKGYWIIADQNATLKADDTAITTRTPLDTTTIPLPSNVGGFYFVDMPATGGNVLKKIMVGNPFPRVVKWKDVWVYDTGSGTKNLLQDVNTYINTAYVYDITKISTEGQPYRAITTATPGFDDEFKPYEGFWIGQIPLITDIDTLQLALPFEK